MERVPAPTGLLFGPPLGTRVHEWLLVDCLRHGAYGVVYRAVRIGHESAGPVALKFAIHPWDARFMREVGMLSLVHHPSVPRLLSQGFWRHPGGGYFPFVVMEWVEGTPLYAWAHKQNPSNAQVLQVLAQLARALEATHFCGAVHRDVKGDNVLVRRSDGRGVLTDFGSGNYPCAARITWQPLPPCTPEYQSPQAWLFERRSEHVQDARYTAGPADDVYALGVTAYRLVTGEYPWGPRLRQDGEGVWQLEELPRRSPRELNPRVAPQLSALIVGMLSLSPEARGTAGALAEALEAAAQRLAKEGEDCRIGTESRASSEMSPGAEALSWKARSAWALAGALLVLWALQAVHAPLQSASEEQRVAAASGHSEGAPANVGEKAREAAPQPAKDSSQKKSISQEPPPEPYREQLTPDAKGRCPGPKQVPLEGACWVEVPTKDAEECEKNNLLFLKDRCYAPVMGSRRKLPPTSAPPAPQ